MRLPSVRVVQEEGQLYLFFVRQVATHSPFPSEATFHEWRPLRVKRAGELPTTDASRAREQR
jgi:hypothetical protein